MAAASNLRPRSIPELTSVRFFAALAVLTFHFGAGFAGSSALLRPAAHFFHNGYLGVSLFFVLSGFILTYTHGEDVVDGRFVRDFYVARFARIYPVYVLALLIALPVLEAPLSLRDAATVLVMLQSWTVPQSSQGYLWVMQAWTLSIELFFYLLFPMILVIFRRLDPRATWCCAGGAGAIIVALGAASIGPGTLAIPLLGTGSDLPLPLLRLPEFIYGVALCRLTGFYPGLGRRIGGHLAGLLVVIAILTVMATADAMTTKAVVSILVGILIVQLTGGEGVVSRVLRAPVLVTLGKASYAIYLVQGPVRAICGRLIAHPYDRFCSPPIIIATGIVVFFLWEEPCRRAILAAYRGRRYATS